MPWARLEDSYFTDRRVVNLSMAAKVLDLAAIAYSARELTDGLLSLNDLRIIAAQAGVDDWRPLAAELAAAGRWEPGEGGTFAIHAYLTYNPARERVLAERQAALDRMHRLRGKPSSDAKAACSPERSPERSGEVRPKFAGPGPTPGPGPTYVPGDEETNPLAPTGHPPEGTAPTTEAERKAIPKPKTPRAADLTPGDIEAFVSEFGPQLGGALEARDRIDAALNHTARRKAIDVRLYVRTWLRNDVRRLAEQAPVPIRVRASPNGDPQHAANIAALDLEYAHLVAGGAA